MVKPDMLFGKRGKSGLVALNLDLAGVESFVKERLGKEVSIAVVQGHLCESLLHLGRHLVGCWADFSVWVTESLDAAFCVWMSPG